MAYISLRKNREGKPYVYLVEGYREGSTVKQRILKSYGSYEELESKEPGIVERLRLEAKNGTLVEKVNKEVTIKLDLQQPINESSKNYGWLLMDGIYKQFEIDKFVNSWCKQNRVRYDLDQVLRLLTYQRILDPCSKSRTVRSQSNLYGSWNITHNHMDRSLDYFEDLTTDLFVHLHEEVKKKIGRNGYLVFYDVTNYYFTIDIDDMDDFDEITGEIIREGLRKRGCSKENRPNPIVQMGLFMDENGIPICYKLFPGNRNDASTYQEAIQEIHDKFHLDRIVVTADKAMNSNRNVKINHDAGNGWLFSQKIRGKKGVSKVLQKFALSEEGWIVNDSGTMAHKSMIRERKLDKNHTVREKVVITWNINYDVREKERRAEAINYAQRLSKPQIYMWSCRRGGKRYIVPVYTNPETGELVELNHDFILDQELIEFDSLFDGINVLVTSEVDMSDKDIIDSYHQLYKIEDCFRVTKTEFNARPVYVWTQSHIEAHFFTCFMALFLVRVLQHYLNWEISPGRIADALISAKAQELPQGYWHVEASEDFRMILEKLNIEWPFANVKKEKMKILSNFVFTTK